MWILGRLPSIHDLFEHRLSSGILAATLIVGAIGYWDLSSSVEEVAFEQRLPERPPPPGDRALTSTGDRGAAGDASPALLANPVFTQPGGADVRPAAPDLDLVDASPSGPLPRIGADGSLPLLAYARPSDRADERPKIAIMITGLGQRVDATNATFHLPGPISLSFSPYAEDLPSLFERARLAGHEVLLELPMEPADYPTNDPGPHTLRASGTVDANIERLTWVLSRAPGYFAVAGPSGVFGGSPEAVPIIESLAAKGVGMVEIDGDRLQDQSRERQLAYTSTRRRIDEIPSNEAIDQALAALEAAAKEQGSVIGIAEPYPITLQRLVAWGQGLADRGFALVPVSAVLIERNGFIDASDQSNGSNVAQSQNN